MRTDGQRENTEGLADMTTVTGVSGKFANTPKIHPSGDVSEK